MKISGKHNADLVGFSIKRNKSHDGREAFIDLDIGVTEDEAASKFGEDFKLLAFGTMRVIEADVGDNDDVDSIGFLQDDIKPGKRVVFEKQRVSLLEDVFEEQPELLKIRTVDGTRKAVARFRVPVDVGRATLITQLAQKIGQTVSVEFDPVQAGFGFKTKNGAPAATAEAQA